MPLVTLTVRKPKSPEFKATVLDAVHAALVSAGVPAADKFQRVLELDAADFRFDPTYPDLKSARDDDFALIEILWSVGRSVKGLGCGAPAGTLNPCAARPNVVGPPPDNRFPEPPEVSTFSSMRLLISSAAGESALPVAFAGHTSWQRLHWMQA